MRIGILTITPNIGFGGNLQAYALLSVLKDMGHDVNVIQYRAHFSARTRISYLLHGLFNRIVKGKYCKLTPESEYEYRRKNLRCFHEECLNFTRKVDTPQDLQKLINKSFDVVVVGSDQVWRPKYVNGIENYFFKGIHPSIIKISYAASFGVSTWELNERQTEECKQLLADFKYVSVREKSGVNLIRQNLCFENNIYNDVDPTLLADKSIYSHFVTRNDSKDCIFSYILDSSESKLELLNIVECELKRNSFRFNTNAEDMSIPLRMRVAPSIDEWISGIYNSEFVVTDSFHGCVFAIIFKKPFIVYANQNRGVDRFTSILDYLDLSERLIFNLDGLDKKIISSKIDWDKVHEKLNITRQKISSRLEEVLK